MFNPFSVYDYDAADREWPHLTADSCDKDILEMAWQSSIDYLNDNPISLGEAIVGESYRDCREMDAANQRLLLAAAEDDAAAVLAEVKRRIVDYVVDECVELLRQHREVLTVGVDYYPDKQQGEL